MYRKHRKYQQKLKEIHAFYSIEKSINTNLKLDTILEKIIKTAIKITDTRRGVIVLFDKSENRIIFEKRVTDNSGVAPAPLPRVGKGIFGRVVKYKRPYLIKDTAKDYRTDKYLMRKGGMKSYVSVPLLSNGDVKGAMAVFDKSNDTMCDNRDVDILLKFAGYVSSVINNINKKEHTERQLQWTKTMEQVAKRINSTLNFQNVLSFIVDSIVKLMKVKICSIRLFDGNSNKLAIVCAKGLSNAYIHKGDPKPGEGLAGKVFVRQKPMESYDLKKTKGKYSALARKEGLCSYLCVPLIAKRKCIGVISVYTVKSHHFTKTEYKTLEILAETSAIAIENARLFKNVFEHSVQIKNRHKQFKRLFLKTIRSLARTLEAKDKYTLGHSHRVSKFSSMLAKKIKLPIEEVETIRIAGLLHDIGKVGVKDDLLNKPDKLTSEEYKKIRKHPVAAVKILEPIDEFREVVNLIKHHHERLDGSGYPDALKGDEIPLGSKILAIADSFDAMISNRPYRLAINLETAKKELCKLTDKYDAGLTKHFFGIIKGFF